MMKTGGDTTVHALKFLCVPSDNSLILRSNGCDVGEGADGYTRRRIALNTMKFENITFRA